MMVYIYGLRCPVAGAIRYIGKAADPQQRLVAHLGVATKSRTYCARWLARLLRDGLKPELIILRTVADGQEWAAAEREEIAKGFAAGWPLTNLTKGGDGGALTEEGRKRKLARMSDPITREKMSHAAKARWSDPVKGAKGRAQNSAPSRRAKLSKSCKKRATPEYRAAQSQRGNQVWSDPEKRQRIVDGITDDTRSRVSAASRKAWKTSPNMRRCLANLTSEESKRKIDAKRAASGAKLAAHWANPEYRARVAEAIKRSWAERKARKDSKA